jgi:hypothetical protein
MTDFSAREFGSLNHSCPIVEVYANGDLFLEIITNKEKSEVEILTSKPEMTLDGSAITSLLELVLPIWHGVIHKGDLDPDM